MVRLPRIVPESRLIGATPTRALISRPFNSPARAPPPAKCLIVAFPTPLTLSNKAASSAWCSPMKRVRLLIQARDLAIERLHDDV